MNQTSQQATTLDSGAPSPARGRTVMGKGEMADRLRAHDWNATALGAMEHWSDTFLCAVNVMLSCRFPSLIFWGDGMLQLYNDSFRHLLAEKHPTALGQSCRECWGEAWNIIGPQLEGVLARGESLYCENVLIPVLRGGKVQDVYWTYSYSPIFDAVGKILGILVICQDVTEQLQARRERDRMAERLDQVLEATNDGVASLDRSWRLTYLNERAKTIVAANGDPTGKNLWETFPNAVFEGSPYVKHYHLAMNERIASEFEAYYPEPLNKWLKLVVNPAKEGIVVFFQDVTAQKNAEAAISEIAARLHAMYSTSLEYIGLLTPDGTILECNRASLDFSGNTRDEMIGRPFWASSWWIHTPGAVEMLQAAIARARAGRDVRYEMPLIRPSGETIFFDFRIAPVRNSAGEVVYLVPEARDITEQKRAEAALIQSEKLAIVGRLVSSIAHEINNPLESVTNLIYLVLTSESLSEANREYLESAERELRRIATITNQTLSFQKKSSKPTSIFCHELIEGGLSIFQGRIVNSRVTVEKRKRALDPVDCFDGEIRQVLNNLLGNALDAMPPSGGRLLIRSREGTNWTTGKRGLVLTFADTGSGINPEVLKKIFDPFFSTKGIGGTGLGLWVSREIVARHRGAIRVRSSQREGRSGTVFTLFLPFEAVSRLAGASGSGAVA